MKNIIQINEKDYIVVALTDLLNVGIISVGNKDITLKEEVKRGH